VQPTGTSGPQREVQWALHRKLSAFFHRFSFLVPGQVLPPLPQSAFAQRPEQALDLASQWKFPVSVPGLAFSGVGLVLPRASLEIPEELPKWHLELALTGTQRAQH